MPARTVWGRSSAGGQHALERSVRCQGQGGGAPNEREAGSCGRSSNLVGVIGHNPRPLEAEPSAAMETFLHGEGGGPWACLAAGDLAVAMGASGQTARPSCPAAWTSGDRQGGGLGRAWLEKLDAGERANAWPTLQSEQERVKRPAALVLPHRHRPVVIRSRVSAAHMLRLLTTPAEVSAVRRPVEPTCEAERPRGSDSIPLTNSPRWPICRERLLEPKLRAKPPLPASSGMNPGLGTDTIRLLGTRPRFRPCGPRIG